jgi:hypothetical protein
MNKYQRTPRLPDEPYDDWMARIEAVRQQDIADNRREAQERRNAAERAEIRTIYADLPTCDDCGGTSFKTTRTIESSPDGITRIVNCRDCGSHFHLILLAKNID